MRSRRASTVDGVIEWVAAVLLPIAAASSLSDATAVSAAATTALPTAVVVGVVSSPLPVGGGGSKVISADRDLLKWW